MNPIPGVSFWWQYISLLAAETAALVGLVYLGAQITKSAIWRRNLWQGCAVGLCVLALCELSGVGREVAGKWAEMLGLKAKALTTMPSVKEAAKPSIMEPVSTNKLLSPTISWIPTLPTPEDPQADGSQPEQAAILSVPSSPGMPPTGVVGPEMDRSVQSERSSLPGNFNLYQPGASLAVTAAARGSTSRPASARADTADRTPPWWPGLIWLVGAALIILRVIFAQILLHLFRRRRQPLADPATHALVKDLAVRLGFRGKVRLMQSSQLTSPISFGLWLPTLGLPEKFVERFGPTQREAMLAHEMAHLAARDPCWHLMADLANAVWWWHPLSWWARRQLHSASEIAADEASLMVANGPTALAECLVELGNRLVPARRIGWMGIEGNGFRSGLGRRVEHLVNMPHKHVCPPNRVISNLVKTLGPIALVAATVIGTAWASPRALTQGANMNTIQQSWKRSLAAFALIASLGTEKVTANTAETPPESEKVREAVQPSMDTRDRIQSNGNPAPAMLKRYGLDKAATPAAGFSGGRQKVQAKLESIFFDELKFPGMPLGEVIQMLAEQTCQRDPEKQGINFIISTPREAATFAGIHQTTAAKKTAEDSHAGLKALEQAVKEQEMRVLDAQDRVNAYREKLNIPEGITDENSAASLSLEQAKSMRMARANAEARSEEIITLLNNLRTLDSAALRRALPTAAPDTLLTELLSRSAQTEQELASLTKQYADTHPDVLRVKRTLDVIDSQIKARIDGILTGLQTQADVYQKQLLTLKKAEDELYKKSAQLARSYGPYFMAKSELAAQQKMLEILKMRLLQEQVDSKLPKSMATRGNNQAAAVVPVAPEPLDLNNVPIVLHTPLRNVKLKDALEVITKVAGVPIQYTVEDYGIVLALKTSGDQAAQDKSKGTDESAPGRNTVYWDSASDPNQGLTDVLRKRYGLRPAPAKSKTTDASPATRDRQTIQEKLAATVFEELSIPNNSPLGEVVKMLAEETRKMDPDKKGVNFIIAQPQESQMPEPTVDPNTGLPVVVNAPLPNPAEFMVRFNLPLRKIRLKDVLDALIKVVNPPIKYTVENYGIVIALEEANPSPPGGTAGGAIAANRTSSVTAYGESGALKVLTFKLKGGSFYQGLEKAFAVKGPTPLTTALQSNEVLPTVRQLCDRLGINLDTGKKALFFNELTSVLMVKATAEDLNLLQAAMETLGSSTVESSQSKPPLDAALR